MDAPLGWLQLRHKPLRLLVAVSGIGFAVLLIMMQLGFRSALFESAVRFHERFNYDIALFSPDSVFIVRPQPFSIRRLYQALALDEVTEVMPVYIFPAVWKNPWNNERRSINAVGFNPEDDLLSTEGFDQVRTLLRTQDVVAFDTASRPEFGPVADSVGAQGVLTTEINDREIDVVGLFKMGTSFGIDGTILTSEDNWLRLFPDRPRSEIQLGLINLTEGADAEAVRDRLRAYLPRDVLVMTKQDFITREKNYWNSATPIGYIFAFGAIMGFVVGAIIVYQILFADVSEHLNEYGTLRALGYPNRFVSGIVIQQAVILAVLGYLPGLALVHWLYGKAAAATNLPLYITQDRAVTVFMMTLAMCAISAMLALRKVRRLDPADVFLMHEPAPIIVDQLCHYFGRGALRKQILFDVSTEIPKGEIVIVTGPSGSGKTTLLTLVGALRSTQEGSVRVLGEELNGAKPRTLEQVRKGIGFIFQQHNLVAALTALQNVKLGLRVTGRAKGSALRERSKEMLEAVGLGDRMHHKPEHLSGGQRQRVAIARALAAEPSMLLADEPTASLDKHSGREIVDRMKVLAKEKGTTILLVTHDNRILDIADRIVHLEDGRLSTFTDAVIANNQHMMNMLADNRQKQPIDDLVADLDEAAFRDLLQEITDESRRFLEATALANNTAFQSMLEQGLFAFTRRLGQMLDVERASLFLVDQRSNTLLLRVAEDLPEEGEIRIPMGSGIAGAVAASGRSVRIDDAYSDSRFNPEVDRQSGFKTRSILCLPIENRDGKVFAVAQLLNRRDGRPFEDDDEARFKDFTGSVGLILETLEELAVR